MLKLSFLGTFSAKLDEINIKEFESSKVRALLAYLMLETDRPHSRDHLAGLFWGDYDEIRAGKSLRQALSNLRKAVGDNDPEHPLFLITSDSIQANKEHPDVWLDTRDFHALLSACEKHPHRRLETCAACAHQLEESARLYRGELLAGFFLKESAAFQNWLMTWRESFHQKMITGLESLVSYYSKRRDYEKAMLYARQLVSLDTWREESHALLIHLLAINGQRSAALRQYKTCCKILLEEFGTEPQPETTRLYQQIIDHEISSAQNIVPKTNLPNFGTTFIGRWKEILKVVEYLQHKDHRLVSVIGTGGVGKTRLAVEVGQEQLYAFEDGVFWIPLYEVDTPEALPLIVADALGLELPAKGDVQSHVRNSLRHRDILLIFDNYERLLPDTSFLVDLLNHAPGVSMLITSREPLRSQVEWLFELDGLSTFVEGDEEKPPAILLLEQRARQIAPGYQISAPETYQDALRLCESLDGLPLGIELAAGMLKKYTCAQINERLSQDIGLLSSSLRDIPVRHRSLLLVFENSWNLLLQQEKQIFAALGIFPAHFTPQAAHEICDATVDVLDELNKKSLVRQLSQYRYSLHPLLRQYARTKQTAIELPVAEINKKFRTHYAGLAGDWEHGMKSGQIQQALAHFEEDWLNLTTCWELALSDKDFETLHALLSPFFWFFEIKGRIVEGETLLQNALTKLLPLKDDAFCAALFFRLQAYHGWLCFRRGNTDTALVNLHQVDEYGLDTLPAVEQAFVANHLAGILYETGQKTKALEKHQQAIQLCEEHSIRWEESLACNHYGSALSMEGDLEKAEYFLQQGLRIAEQEEFTWITASTLTNLAILAYFRQDYPAAIELFLQSNDESARYGDIHRSPSVNHNNLAECYAELGQLDKAREHLNLALHHFKECGNLVFLPYVYNTLAGICFKDGKLDAARDALNSGVKSALDNRMKVVLNNLLADYARYFLLAGQIQTAAKVIQYVLNSSDTIKEGLDKAKSLQEEFSQDLQAELSSLSERIDLEDILPLLR